MAPYVPVVRAVIGAMNRAPTRSVGIAGLARAVISVSLWWINFLSDWVQSAGSFIFCRTAEVRALPFVARPGGPSSSSRVRRRRALQKPRTPWR